MNENSILPVGYTLGPEHGYILSAWDVSYRRECQRQEREKQAQKDGEHAGDTATELSLLRTQQ